MISTVKLNIVKKVGKKIKHFVVVVTDIAFVRRPSVH